MCGIFGIYGNNVNAKKIHTGLKKLQYRGYDSWGYYINNVSYKRFTGKIPDEINEHKESNFGMGHTRWATHGEPSEKNTHPISYSNGNWFVVHNGIIQNHKELVEEYNLKHETDTDTEVIVSLCEKFYQFEKNFEKIIENVIQKIEGTYAFLIVSPQYFPDEVIATCKGSPLILCETQEGLIFTSDQVTLPPTSKYMYAKHGDIIHVKNDGTYEFTKTEIFDSSKSCIEFEDEKYKHYMLKEIIETPNALRNMFKGRIKNKSIKLGGNFEFLKKSKTWVLIGCGSSYNACLVARPFLEKEKIVHVELASDFVLRRPILDVENTSYIIVSQSGETRDCIEACEYITDEWSGKCFGINNRPGCLLDSKTSAGIHMNIGTEKSVPATKSFTATIIALLMILDSPKYNLESLPDVLESHIQRVLHEKKEEKNYDSDIFIIGDSWGLGLAKEFSLKLQEVAYIKSLAFTGYEMKHGPLALIDENSKVFYYGLSCSQIPNILKSRGANIIHTSEHFSFTKMLCDVLTIQIFVYKIALSKGLPIDTPRNLAKSVTV